MGTLRFFLRKSFRLKSVEHLDLRIIGALQLLISEGGIFYGRLPDAAVRNFFGFCGRCESAEMLRIAGEKSDANSTIHISSGKVSQNTVLGKHVLRTGFEYGS